MDELLILPASFAAGTTVKLRRSFSGFPASDGWVYGLYLRGVGSLDVAGTPDGDEWTVVITASASAALAAGTYRWVERVSLSGEVYDVGQGVVTVGLNLATAGAGDAVSHAERTLAIIEAAIEDRLPAGMESYQVAGRAVTKIPIAELYKLRAAYRLEVWRRQNPNQLLPSAQVVFRRA